MTRQKMVSQFLVIACCATLVFAAGTDAMAAAVSAPSQSSVTPMKLASNNINCVGAAAFSSVVYMVNGHVVPTLNNNVTEGSTVTVHFTLKNGCDNTQVGIAGYKALSNHGNTQAFSLQTLAVHDDGTFSGTNSVSIVVPNCFFQVDFYTGVAAQPGNSYSASGRLVASAVGGTSTCVSGESTTTSTTEHTTTTTGITTTTQATVLGESISHETSTTAATPTTAAPQVLGESVNAGTLPNTGFDLVPVLCLGLGLMGLGGFMVGMARRRTATIE